MSTSAVSSPSILQKLQSFYQSRQTDLKQLGNDIKSGNLDAAKQDFQALAVLGEGGPFGNSEPFTKSSKVAAFNTVGEALQAGDLARAQTAFNKLTGAQNSTATVPAAVVNLSSAPQSTATATTGGSASSIYQELQAYRQQRTTDLVQLGTDLQAGNLTAAQQDFAALTALGQSGPNRNGQTFLQTNRAQDFQAIGQALQNGDVTGAKTAFTALAGTFQGQNQQAQTAVSVYSGAPIEIVIDFVAPPVPAAGPVPPSTGPDVNPAPPASTAAPITTASSTPEQTGLSVSPGTSTFSSATTPEIVINLGQGNGAASGTSRPFEIDINLGSASGASGSSTSAAPEIVINFGQGGTSSSGAAPELTIDFQNASAGEQVVINGGQGQNGNPAPAVTLNLQPNHNYELILNLLNSGTAAQNNTSGALSLTA
jgi:hypothetical protein